MGNAPNSEMEELMLVNERFNKQVVDVETGLHTGFISLGRPGPILLSTGLSASELYIREAVLRSHMKKHGLGAADLQNLPLALRTPLMVYEWGCKAKSLIVITSIEVADGRKITAAIKLERQGKKLKVNELTSIHGKDIGQLIFDMSVREKDFGRNKLRYVDKKKTLDWLGIAPPKGIDVQSERIVDKTKIAVWPDLTPPKGADVRTEQQFYVANIINAFENPKLPSE